MSTVLVFAIFGLATGALYSFGGIAIVAQYRGSAVINFSAGADGMIAAFVLWILHSTYHVPMAVAVICAILAATLLGLITYLLLLPLRHASPLTRNILTLAILVTLTGAIDIKYSNQETINAPSVLPTNSIRFLKYGIGEDRLIIIGLVIVVAAVLWAAFHRTRFGLAANAGSENTNVLASLGWNPALVASLTWALGGAIAGIAGILLAPIVGLTSDLGAQLLVPSLVVAVAANFDSIVLATAAGLGLGLLQDEAQRWVPVAGFSSAVPFLFLLLFVLIRGSGRQARGERNLRLPRVTTGQVKPVKVAIYAVACLAVGYFLLPLAWVTAATITVTVAIVLESVVLITGFTGQISLTQWIIAGLGALVTAWCVSRGLPDLVAIGVALLAGIPIGVIAGWSALRARGMTLAIATLAFAEAAVDLVLTNNSVDGGGAGYNIGDLHIFGINFSATTEPHRYWLLAGITFTLVAVALANLRRGSVGRRLLAVSGNERAASSLGVDVRVTKLMAFSLASIIACIGGVFSVFSSPYALFNGYDVTTSISQVSYAILGGIGFVTGPINGSMGTSGGIGSEIIQTIRSSDTQYLTVLFGLMTILILTTAPDGLIPLQSRQNQARMTRIKGWLRLAAGTSQAPAPSPIEPEALPVITRQSGRDGESVLEVRGLSVRYGGVRAVNDVSFQVRSKEVLGIIGPNGAGKTTLLDAIAGDAPGGTVTGAVMMNGTDISHLPTHRRCRVGLARTFQSLELFDQLTVAENLAVASDHVHWWNWLADLVRPRRTRLSSDAEALVTWLGLRNALDQQPTELPFGQRRMVAVTRAVLQGCDFLLLDEPGAGLDERARSRLAELISQLAMHWNLGILLIDHDVNLVRSASTKMIALEFGTTIADGDPDAVCTAEVVVTSYLGLPEEETPDGLAGGVTLTEAGTSTGAGK